MSIGVVGPQNMQKTGNVRIFFGNSSRVKWPVPYCILFLGSFGAIFPTTSIYFLQIMYYKGSVRGVYAPCSFHHFTQCSLFPSTFCLLLLFSKLHFHLPLLPAPSLIFSLAPWLFLLPFAPFLSTTKCFGQLWVWHMFYGVGLWWVAPPIKIHGSYWNTVW